MKRFKILYKTVDLLSNFIFFSIATRSNTVFRWAWSMTFQMEDIPLSTLSKALVLLSARFLIIRALEASLKAYEENWKVEFF